MPAYAKPAAQERQEQTMRAARAAASGPDRHPWPRSLLRMTEARLVDPAGAPQTHRDLIELVDAPSIADERAEARAVDRAAEARERDWATVPELARLIRVDQSTIKRAITRGDLVATRPGGSFGRYRLTWQAIRAYLVGQCGYTVAEVATLHTEWERGPAGVAS